MEAQEWQGFPSNDNGGGNLAPSMGGNENLLGGGGRGLLCGGNLRRSEFDHLNICQT